MNATYRFYHRPEGWLAACEIGDVKTLSTPQETEKEAIKSLNMELALLGLHKYRFSHA